jgi:hypothetical protein
MNQSQLATVAKTQKRGGRERSAGEETGDSGGICCGRQEERRIGKRVEKKKARPKSPKAARVPPARIPTTNVRRPQTTNRYARQSRSSGEARFGPPEADRHV